METKIMAGVFVLALIAFAGVAFAMAGAQHWETGRWNSGNATFQNATEHGFRGNWLNATGNWTGNATFQNATWHGCKGNGLNATGNQTGGCGKMLAGLKGRKGMLNQTQTARANATQIGQFKQAVLSGDYQTAQQLHVEYGLGGALFGKLNETTFVEYANIVKMNSELMQNLGMNASSAGAYGFGGIGPMQRGAMRFGAGSRGFVHRLAHPALQNSTS